MYAIMPYTNSEILASFSPVCILLIYFRYLIALAAMSSSILIREGERDWAAVSCL